MDKRQNNHSEKKEAAFTLLYALIVSSLVLATVLSIVNVALKQKTISGLGRQSQIAFYAANSGMECALYWAIHERPITTTVGGVSTPLFRVPRGDNNDFFTQYDSPLDESDDLLIRLDDDIGGAPIDCFGQNIVSNASLYSFNTQYTFTGNSWFDAIRGDNVLATTGATMDQLCGEAFIDTEPSLGSDDYRVWLFRMIMPQGGVNQENPCAEVAVCRRLDSADLSISSRGYNTCDITSENIVERAVRLIQL